MKKSEIKNLIDQTLGLKKEEKIEESYVARPKQYDIKTELLLQKTKQAHNELYQGYINSLNDVSAKLDTVSSDGVNSNSSDFRSLKHNEQFLLNAVYLHELYFSNIGDPFSEINMDSIAFMRLSRDFGSFDEWQQDLLNCCYSVSSGWALCGLNIYLKRYQNIIIDDHSSNVPVGFVPTLVIDLWEHARRDYMNDKKAYVYSMLKELNWQVIEKRFQKTDLILSAIQ